jgi:hypothetical protein
MRYADKSKLYNQSPAGGQSAGQQEQVKMPTASRPAPKVNIGNSPAINSNNPSSTS